MRHVGPVLPISLLFLAACSSTQSSSDEGTEPVDGGASSSATTSESTPAPSQEGLGAQAATLSLKEQKKKLLLETHLDAARAKLDLLDLEGAETEVTSALDIAPDNLEAKALRTEVWSLMGRPTAEAETLATQLGQAHDVRVQQLRAEAEDHFRKGQLALERDEYDKAIAELSLTLNHIQYSPYSIDWQGIDESAEALMQRAQDERAAAAEAARENARRTATAELQTLEEQDRIRRETVVANILQQAIDAFENAEYDDAMDFADQALRRDPRNSQATEIRDASFRAGREKVRTDYIVAKREEFANWREHLQELTIPWTNVITFPDPDDWRALTAARSVRRGLDLTQKISETEFALAAQLETTKVSLPDIDAEESLETVVALVRQFTLLPIVVDPAAENAAIDEGIEFDFDLQNQITVAQALNLITDQAGEEVTWTIRHDAVLVTTREKARGAPVIYNHDVQDLIMGLTDFTGPRIDRIRLLDELEDDDGGGPFGGILEATRLIEVEDLATLIQENVAVGTWEDDGVTIEPGEGFILITHTAQVQQMVKDFLEDLRRFNSSLVTIESRFMTVGDNWIQEIGVDLRGLDGVEVSDVTNGLEDGASRGLDNGGTGNEGQGAAGPPSAGLFYDDGSDGDFRGTAENFFGDNLGEALTNIGGMTFQLTFLNDLQLSAILRAVEKTTQFELVNSQMLSVHNTQRAYVTVINQTAYIQDFDVEVAQFQAVADPQINVLHEGVVLDVRPTIHHDRKYLTLEIQPTVANVIALREFSSTLGGNTSPVSFQLPELEVQSVNTSAIIPDGGSILLGGLSDIRNVERRAEVPWLARIPVLGFLFKSEGYSDEKSSLMILIRARITDVHESTTEKLERRD